MKVNRSLLFFFVALAAPITAQDQRVTGEQGRIELRDTLGVSLNLPGLQNQFELTQRWDGGAWGARHALSPSFTRLELWGELVPVPPIALRVGLEPALYFGRTGALLRFEDHAADFDEPARNAREDEMSGFGGHAYMAPSLRLRVGPVLAVTTAEVEWWWADVSGPVYYEPSRDALLDPGGDRLHRLTGLVLVGRERDDGRGLRGGARYRLQRTPRARINDVQRLSGLGTYGFGGRRFGLSRPTVIVEVGVYLEDRFKQGEAFVTVALRWGLGG